MTQPFRINRIEASVDSGQNVDDALHELIQHINVYGPVGSATFAFDGVEVPIFANSDVDEVLGQLALARRNKDEGENPDSTYQ